MQRRGGSTLFGIVLIVVGLWLLLRAFGVAIPGITEGWPLLLILGAAASLYGGLTESPRSPEAVWFGVTGVLAGLLFLYITVGEGTWEDMSWLWPAFPAAAGVGWLASWLVAPRDVSALVMGLIALTVGALGYAFTTNRLDPDLGRQLLAWWPMILILVGAGYVIQYFIQRR